MAFIKTFTWKTLASGGSTRCHYVSISYSVLQLILMDNCGRPRKEKGLD